MKKEEYADAIMKKVQECNDIPLLDLILKLLCESL